MRYTLYTKFLLSRSSETGKGEDMIEKGRYITEKAYL
jgi:hypothetical protein